MQQNIIEWPQYFILLLFACLLVGIIFYVKQCMICRRRIRELQAKMKNQPFENPGWRLSGLYDQISYWENMIVEQSFDVTFSNDQR